MFCCFGKKPKSNKNKKAAPGDDFEHTASNHTDDVPEISNSNETLQEQIQRAQLNLDYQLSEQVDSNYCTIIECSSFIRQAPRLETKTKYFELKNALLESSLKKDMFKFLDKDCIIFTKYSLTEWEAFINNNQILNIKIPEYTTSICDSTPTFQTPCLNIKSLIRKPNDAHTSDFEYFKITINDDSKTKYSDEQLYTIKAISKPNINPPRQDKLGNALLEICENAFKTQKGIIFGDNYHTQDIAKITLVTLMPDLAKQNVTTLYLEHFSCTQQQSINHFLQTGVFSPELDAYLTNFEDHLYSGFRELLQAARQAKIQVICCENYDSYEHSNSERRIPMGTLAMYDSIKANPAPGNWIALIGPTHLGTDNGIGLDNITGALAIGLQPRSAAATPSIRFQAKLNDEVHHEILLDVNVKLNIEDLNKPFRIKDHPKPVEYAEVKTAAFKTKSAGYLDIESSFDDNDSTHKPGFLLNTMDCL